jgi:hypothetical protein
VIKSQNRVRMRYGLFVLAVLLLVFAAVCISLGSPNFPIRSLGLVAIIASVYLIRISRVHHASSLPKVNSVEYGGPSRLLWILSLALVPLLGASGYLLHIDAATGGHEVWPVDVFAGVALVCAGVWSALAAKMFGGGPGN